jgi:hypothetical protein
MVGISAWEVYTDWRIKHFTLSVMLQKKPKVNITGNLYNSNNKMKMMQIFEKKL